LRYPRDGVYAAEMPRIGPHSRPDKLQIVDGRLAEAKLMARVRAELTQHLGGKPSATQRILIDRAAALSLRIHLMDRESARSGGMSERNLQPIVAETVSRRAIGRGWDGFLRLGASVRHGWYPATEALDRFGSAAAGDPVYETGNALGKLLRTLYLCDYLSNPVFRTEILDLLNQGEAVHSLQRAIHNGMITAKHGRTTEQLGAISGALTLLANIVMAWNTHRIQAVIDRTPNDHPDDVLSRLAPIGHKHINMRGILTFDLARYASSLLRPAFLATETAYRNEKS
jgi:hypothetical protein